MVLYALIRKEWTLLLRDWHALLLLFAMPAVFILIMSLALQDRFAMQQGVSISYYLVDEDDSPASQAVAAKFAASKELRPLTADAPLPELMERVRRDRVQFLARIPAGFGKALLGRAPLPVEMYAGPDVEPALYRLFQANLQADLGKVYLQQTLMEMSAEMPGATLPPLDLSAVDKLLHDQSLASFDGQSGRPSSVQQNVPAWLLFAMFFIAIPLSTTWVQERQLGTYSRLRSMGVDANALLLGKLVPYLLITLLQVVLMLAIGVYLVPWLGGDQLTLGHAPLALCLMTLAAGFAAVAYALLVANLVSTSEQATIFTGVANLLMAALGGIMVPRFLMPPTMQTLSHYSPMAWGLQGFLDVFLRGGGLLTVAPHALMLFAFGIACLALAAVRMGGRAV